MSTLKDRLQRVLTSGRVESARAWSIAAGKASTQVQKLLERGGTDEGRVELATLNALAEKAGVSPIWLAYGITDLDKPITHDAPDMTAGSLLLKLRSQPALQQEIDSNPDRWKVSTIVRALTLELEHDAGGRPHGGWFKILDDIEEGRYERIGSGIVARSTKNQIGPRPKIPKKR